METRHCMEPAWHHSHTITTPSMPSLCVRTSHKLASISAQAKTEEPAYTYWWSMVSWGGSNANCSYPGLVAACYRYGNKIWQCSCTITMNSMLSHLGRTKHKSLPFQHSTKLNLICPLAEGEWWVEVEALSTVFTHVWYSLAIGMEPA